MPPADALAVMMVSSGGNWSPAKWKDRLSTALPGREVVLLPDEPVDPARIRYAAVWKPDKGALARLPNLEVVFNLGAGVDALLADAFFPKTVTLVRVADNDLTNRMGEYVVFHCLRYHRRHRLFEAAQARLEWLAPDQWAAASVRVGVMGLGVIGSDSARKLKIMGFDVAGWSRSPKTLDGIATFHGTDGLAPFLARTDILVVILPLTPDTRHILNRQLFQGLARDGVLGGPALINAGRGGLQVEADILACLDDGTLQAATLDVFETEPLPADSPLWRHPAVDITPHNAADTDPDEISRYVARQIVNHEAGRGLVNVVNLKAGY
jgi:glyoxylate/hydroxypyruvate reductase A